MAALTSSMQQTYPLASRAPLEVSTLPLPGDVRVRACFQPQAPLGDVEVQVGLGRGSVGRGQRVGDDPAMHIALVARLAEHLVRYCREFGEAAALEEPNWDARLMAAVLSLEPAPVAGCRVCGTRATLESGWCVDCDDMRRCKCPTCGAPETDAGLCPVCSPAVARMAGR